MTADALLDLHGVPVLMCSADGELVRGEREAMDLVGAALGHAAQLVAVPVERLVEDFFQLRTRLAGEITQKFVNYRLGLAVVGDISDYVAASSALRDFVAEANRGRHIWFVANVRELGERLRPARG